LEKETATFELNGSTSVLNRTSNISSSICHDNFLTLENSKESFDNLSLKILDLSTPIPYFVFGPIKNKASLFPNGVDMELKVNETPKNIIEQEEKVILPEEKEIEENVVLEGRLQLKRCIKVIASTIQVASIKIARRAYKQMVSLLKKE